MQSPDYPFYLNDKDVKYFTDKFDEINDPNMDDITFDSLKDIVLSSNCFNRPTALGELDKIKKRLAQDESKQMMVPRHDYFVYLEKLKKEHDRFSNERDPEISELFSLLSNNETTLTTKRLTDIITAFELPIVLTEFFSPIGTKTVLAFSDFCLLFKAQTASSDIFFKTFSSSFMNLNENMSFYNGSTKNVFPLKVVYR